MKSSFPPISTLIDGYNLMLGNVVSPDRKSKRSLHDSRLYFLQWLESRLTPQLRSAVCVVFDTSRTSETDQQTIYHGIRVIYSASHLSADECIQKLIKEHPHPQKLTVVSSDHQIQRTAKARGAIAIDSEAWIESQESRLGDKTAPSRATDTESEKPDGHVDARQWLDEFGF